MDPPEPDLPKALAISILGRDTDLDRRILSALAEEPHRYSELKPLLGGRGDHNLTVALQRLQDKGVVERRTSAREHPVVHRYSLSSLGEHVLRYVEGIEALTM